MDDKLLLGFDIGGTKIGIGLGNESGKIYGSCYRDNRDTDPAEVLPWIVRESNRLAAEAGIKVKKLIGKSLKGP